MPMSTQVYSDLTFADLDLPDGLRAGIAQAGFSRCTPIQAESLPRNYRYENVM